MKAFSGLPTLAASLGHNTHWLSHAPLEIILGGHCKMIVASLGFFFLSRGHKLIFKANIK